jgi:hypothetical protein
MEACLHVLTLRRFYVVSSNPLAREDIPFAFGLLGGRPDEDRDEDRLEEQEKRREETGSKNLHPL